MKTSYILIGLGTLGLLGGAALAEEPRRGDRMFQRIDTNADGRITRAEADAFRNVRFERMDYDGDGVITLDEMQDAARRRAPERAAKRFERMDRNGDGALTRAELADAHAARFARMDANGDGFVTREEVRALRERRGG